MSELKNYEVVVTAYARVVVVGAESREQAVEFAQEAVTNGSFEIEDAAVESEIPGDKLEAAKRHAHAVSEE